MARTDSEALDRAQARALAAMEVLLEVMADKDPPRNVASRLTAAIKVLEIAGVGAIEAERRHQDLVRWLKGKVPAEAYVAVLRAVSGYAEAGSRAPTH